jgi:hypothetical protein
MNTVYGLGGVVNPLASLSNDRHGNRERNMFAIFRVDLGEFCATAAQAKSSRAFGYTDALLLKPCCGKRPGLAPAAAQISVRGGEAAPGVSAGGRLYDTWSSGYVESG